MEGRVAHPIGLLLSIRPPPSVDGFARHEWIRGSIEDEESSAEEKGRDCTLKSGGGRGEKEDRRKHVIERRDEGIVRGKRGREVITAKNEQRYE